MSGLLPLWVPIDALSTARRPSAEDFSFSSAYITTRLSHKLQHVRALRGQQPYYMLVLGLHLARSYRYQFRQWVQNLNRKVRQHAVLQESRGGTPLLGAALLAWRQLGICWHMRAAQSASTSLMGQA